jgi:hypothetical protein
MCAIENKGRDQQDRRRTELKRGSNAKTFGQQPLYASEASGFAKWPV